MKRIGIIGVGSTVAIGSFHEMAIRNDKRAVLTAVYGLNIAKTQKWVAEKGLSGTCKACESLDEFYSLIDAVVICTPTATHLEYILSAVANGKDFLCEKPLAGGARECEIAIDAMKGKNIVGFVGFIYRSANFTNKIKEIVAEKIGKVYTYSCHFGGKRLANPNVGHEWRFKKQFAGSGAISDFGAHVIDTAIFTCGLEFEKISGFTQTFITERKDENGVLLPVETDDSAVISAVATSGALASFTVSRVGHDEMGITITGEGGMIMASGRTPEFITYWKKEIGGAYTGNVLQIDVEKEVFFDDWFKTQMSHFIDVISGERDDYPTIEDGLEVERVIGIAREVAGLSE
ncbi:MAG: Gfo/Idh/MocA family oxidoreductase [Bacillota bacterium]